MALVASVIELGWQALANGNRPVSATDAADKISDLYNNYSLTATANAIPAVIPPSAKLQLKNILLPYLTAIDTSWSASAFASALANGILAYWFSSGANFGAGVLTAFPGQGAIIAALTALFSRNISMESAITNKQISSQSIANILDAGTKTIIVTFPGPIVVTVM